MKKFALFSASFLCVSVYAGPINIPSNFQAGQALPSREMQQIKNKSQQLDREEQIQDMREKAKKEKPVQKILPSNQSGNFQFFLNSVKTTPSELLDDREITEAVRPFLHQQVNAQIISNLLQAINTLYRQKGYMVCQATIMEQRISNGELTVTLIEGKTDKVTVRDATTHEIGLKDTSTEYVKDAINLTPGKVANYSTMSDDLVHFNMTHDVQMAIDMHPGETVGTTSYDLFVAEPEPRFFNFFADSMGTRSTGRLRVGVGFTERSLFGFRDRLQIIGLGSEGSQSVLGSYSFPLNSQGTRLTASASAGKVDVVNGPSEPYDIDGTSSFYSLRLEHPLHVSSSSKLTGYVQASRQKSKTDIFSDLRINETTIKNYTLGLEQLWLSSGKTLYLSGAYVVSNADDAVFHTEYDHRRIQGNFSWTQELDKQWMYTINGAFQAHLSGDDMVSSEYFYLGSSNGVRGYDNDIISSQNGFYSDFELTYRLDGNGSNVFSFFDWGHLSGKSPYTKRDISSVGFGGVWAYNDTISAKLTSSFPLEHQWEGGHGNKARLDFAVNVLW